MNTSRYSTRYSNIITLCAILLCMPTTVYSKIKILYTAAIIEKHFQMRMEEYLHSLKTLQSFGYDPYIVESVLPHGPTFFDDNNVQHILYTHTSNSKIRNKGVNEFISIQKAFDAYQFDDDDIVVKLSGRCYFATDLFLKNIEQNPNIDAFVKYDRQKQVFTGCFALRARYFKDLLANIDFNTAEKKMINLERIVADYIKKIIKHGAQVEEIFEIGMIAHYFCNGDNRVIYYR